MPPAPKKFLSKIWSFIKPKPRIFTLEYPDYANLIHIGSGLYVHRMVELKVNAKRLSSIPDNVEHGAISKLSTHHFFALGVSSSYINPSKYEQHGEDLVWREVVHLSKDDFKGKTKLGAHVKWEKEGEATVSDNLEIFKFPQPDINQIDTWSHWIDADSSRSGTFAWHAEVHKHETEKVPAIPYPFQVRFKLILSKHMFP